MELVIIDEISTVLGKLFYQIHKHLNEIFTPGQGIPFGGKSIAVWEDLHQLQPGYVKPVFTFNVTKAMEGFISVDLWHSENYRNISI